MMIGRASRNWSLALCLALAVVAWVPAQSVDSGGSDLELSLTADAWFPGIVRPDAGISTVFGADLQVSFLHLGPFSLLARGDFHILQTGAATSLTYGGAAVGASYTMPFGERFDLSATAYGGLGVIPDASAAGLGSESYGLYQAGLDLNLRYRLSAGMRVGAFLGYDRLATPTFSFVDAPAVGIGIWIVPGDMLRTRGRVVVEEIDVEPVFPVLRSWYDTEPLGSVTIRNLEDGPIEQVNVFFQVPDYMGGERLTMRIDRIEAGASADVPLYAVFDERVLTLTENTSSVAEVSVEYLHFGSELTVRETFPLQIYHRNTMTWADDRRAGAFVSPTDPAALWFARSASSVARDRMRTNLPQNMQVALAVFEAMRLYGMNYVIDPNSSYIELSQNASAIDFLQYPSETLSYRGGDCDDLSIVYASLLESAGIGTAFITIPAHIYLAFDLGLTEEEAVEQFFDPGLLIIKDGRAWAPIEVTMVREGFVKAWRVGAKQWVDNQAAGNTGFFEMEDAWQRYPPSALPDADARFDLPDEGVLMAAFDDVVDRFVTREMGPVMEEFEAALAEQRDPPTLNDYGVELAEAGMLDRAWERFAEAADGGYAWAWNNLASIAFIRRDFDLALDYYSWADSLLPNDPVATLGLARTSYELDRYHESEVFYQRLAQGAPVLADQFTYLASVYGGTGRAWSMADRLATTVWSEPDLDFSYPTAPEPEPDPVVAVQVEPPEQSAPEPAAQPEPVPVEPEPEIASAQEAPKPPTSEIVLAPGPNNVAVPEEEPATTPEAQEPAPPVLEQSAPEDLGVAERIADQASAPPQIAQIAPEDVDIAERTAIALADQIETQTNVVVGLPAGLEPAMLSLEAPELRPEPLRVAFVLPAEREPDPEVRSVREPEPEGAAELRQRSRTERAVVVVPPDYVLVIPVAPEPEQRVAAVVTTPEDSVLGELTAAGPISRRVWTPWPEAPSLELDPGSLDQSVGSRQALLALLQETLPSLVEFRTPEVLDVTGSWSMEGHVARMTDPWATYAKLVVPSDSIEGATTYRITARSTGVGLLGLGIHIHGQGSWTHGFFGGGESILVWLTRDPAAHGDAHTRLQLYRSTGEWEMEMVQSVIVPRSVLNTHDYVIDYDPEAGTIDVQIDGTSYLSADGFENSADFDYAILRALNTAEFSDLSISPTNGANQRGAR